MTLKAIYLMALHPALLAPGNSTTSFSWGIALTVSTSRKPRPAGGDFQK